MITRRSLIGGFAGLLAAPTIVRASSLMAVKPLPLQLIGFDLAAGVSETLLWRVQTEFDPTRMETRVRILHVDTGTYAMFAHYGSKKPSGPLYEDAVAFAKLIVERRIRETPAVQPTVTARIITRS